MNVIELVPFRFAHLEYIKPNAVQTDEWAALLQGDAEHILSTGPAMSLFQSGVCLGAAGLVCHWKGRAEAWALFADSVGVVPMRHALRCMRSVIQSSGFRRIDMVVRKGNIHGHVLARSLGFEMEAELQAYLPTGDNAYIYARVKR